jgi:tetraacyldisaccharide 4'-kinase
LAARLPDVPHLVHRDRRESARIAIDELEMQVLILDDGFQHRQLARDLDVVLIDALCPFGFDYLLPRGLLRESIAGLKRADVVVITRCDAVGEQQLRNLENTIQRYAPKSILAHARFTPQAWLQSNGERQVRDSHAGRRALMLCAIGNPFGFQQTLKALNVNVIGQILFADHHSFSTEDLDSVREQAEALGAEIVVCTWKDLVKINRNRLGPFPLYALEIQAEITQGQRQIEEKIDSISAGLNTD